jgi:hypothetical protein
MSKSVQLWVLACAMTVADLAIFVYCLPVICQAWGSNREFMGALFAGIIVWVESLANLWRARIRDLQLARIARLAFCIALVCPTARGKERAPCLIRSMIFPPS